MDPLPRMLVIAGLVLVAAGLWLHFGPAAPGLGLGRLPGDIRIERPGTRVYVPVTTSILLSVVLSLLFWLFSKWR